ncbi:conjugal transfer protein TrbL family protein [Bacteroides heparinolyticus]|uniref:conjugal transfer protein TrbL family protein n=1 Tax=Prevotella heparinolytica TaxID=28113 RepID=UPI0035A09627
MMDGVLRYGERAVRVGGEQTAEYLGVALRFENVLNDPALVHVPDFERIYNLISVIATIILVLMIIKKGFDTYILWREGDADIPATTLIKRAILAVVLIYAFPFVYQSVSSLAVSIYNVAFVQGSAHRYELPDEVNITGLESKEEFKTKLKLRLIYNKEIYERLGLINGHYSKKAYPLPDGLSEFPLAFDDPKNEERFAEEYFDYIDGLDEAEFTNHKITLIRADSTWLYEDKGEDDHNLFLTLLIAVVEFLLWFQMVKTGIQLLVLRVVFPFVAINVLSGSPTLYLSYIGLIGKTIAAVALQLFTYTIGYNMTAGASLLSNSTAWIGVFIMIAGLKIPTLVMNLTTNTGTGGEAGGAIRAASGTVFFIRNMRGLFSGKR